MRIPVAGPEPFNSLVVVHGTVATVGFSLTNMPGAVRRWRIQFGTPFLLAGYDPRVTPDFQHSTTAVINAMAALDETMQAGDEETWFVIAVDRVDGFFHEGRWWIAAEWAFGIDEDVPIAIFGAHYSSWVLCYEPPLEHPPPGQIGIVGEVRPYQAFLERLPDALGDTGIRKLRYRTRERLQKPQRSPSDEGC